MGGLPSLSWAPFPDAPASAALSKMDDPVAISPRQISSTVSPVLLDDHLRKILGPNPHLSDNKLLRSWEYAIWMMAYCVACTLFGVLAVTLLPDPKTLQMIRGGGMEDDDQTMDVVQNMMMMEAQNKMDFERYKKDYGATEAAQNMVGASGPIDDTDGYIQGYGALETAQNIAEAYGSMDDTDEYYQGFGEQNSTGGQEANIYGTQGSMSSAAQDTKLYDGYNPQDTSVLVSDGYRKKKPSKWYNRYKDTSREPPKRYYDYWAQFNHKQQNYRKSPPEKQGPENIPPSTHYQGIHGDGEGFEGSRPPLVSEESSYTGYSSRPS